MTEKNSPEGAADSVALDRVIQSAAQGQADDPLVVRMKVSGGVEGERFNLDFEGDGAGSIQCGMHCEMSGRDHATQLSVASTERWQQTLGAISVASMAVGGNPTPIPPDSLVGQIEIRSGAETITVLFMADEGQAESAGFAAPAGVLQAADVIYDLAAQQLGATNVRP